MESYFVIEQCYKRLPYNLQQRPWEATNHGKALLENDQQLDAYIAAYGEMHIIKCRAALQNLPTQNLELYNYEIFDWGCGQGITTLTTIEFLQARGLLGRLAKITLIEPSKMALDRAKRWVQDAAIGVEVVAVNRLIPNDNNTKWDDVCCSRYISINLFSNILDITSLSLSWLAQKTAQLAPMNYMVCVGPKFSSNTRIKDFCGYFNPQSYFSSIETYQYAYTTKTHHPFGCETRCFIHQKEDLLDLSYIEKANNQSFTDDYDYAVECFRGIVCDKTLAFFNNIRTVCSKSFLIFMRPQIGIDACDLVLANISRGIIILNVCHTIEDLEAEYKRIENIKSHIYNIYLKSIKVDSIINTSVYNCVKTALFFPNHTEEQVLRKIEELQNQYDYLIKIFKSDTNDDLERKLNTTYSQGFRYDYYDELLHIITGHWHSYKDGDTNFKLSPKQQEIVKSKNTRLRIKGVAGCGKTQVVANIAVERHLQTGSKVLILTFNISLIQYIRMRINQIPADFSTKMFEIMNYHQFFKSMANRYSLSQISLSDFDKTDFFKEHEENIEKYKTIIIDEVQDFKSEWMESIFKFFLDKEEGYISVLGDGEQNIYERDLETETKMPRIPTFPGGRWREMSERVSMRIINPKIAYLSYQFANSFISDEIKELNISHEFAFEKMYLKYWNIDSNKSAFALAKNIYWIINEHHLRLRDISVLSASVNILRDIEHYYTKEFNTKSMINFETLSQYNVLKTKQLSTTFFRKDLEEIRRAAKTHFTTDCDDIKFSTIHSFKGWESQTIILLLQPEMMKDEKYDGYYIQERENTPALIYTALTRAQKNLFIINLNNKRYHDFFKSNIQ